MTQNSQGQDQEQRSTTQTNIRAHKKESAPKGGAILFTSGIAMAAFGVGLVILQGPLADLTMKLAKNGLQAGHLVLTGAVMMGLGAVARQLRQTQNSMATDSNAIADLSIAVNGLGVGIDGVQSGLQPVQSEVQTLRSEVHQFAGEMKDGMEKGNDQTAMFHVAGSVDKLAAHVDKTLKKFHEQMEERMSTISSHVDNGTQEMRDTVAKLEESSQGPDISSEIVEIVKSVTKMDESVQSTQEFTQKRFDELSQKIDAQASQQEEFGQRMQEQARIAEETRAAVETAQKEIAPIQMNACDMTETQEVSVPDTIKMETVEQIIDAIPEHSISDITEESIPEITVEQEVESTPEWNLQADDSDAPEAIEEQPALEFIEPAMDLMQEMEPTDREECANALEELVGSQDTSPYSIPDVQIEDQGDSIIEAEGIQEESREVVEAEVASPEFASAEPSGIPGAPSSPYPLPVPLNEGATSSDSDSAQQTEGSSMEKPVESPYKAPKEPMRFRFPGLGRR